MIVIGIAGGSASGKTSITNHIQSTFYNHSITIIHQDDYYKDLTHLTMDERKKINFDHPNAFDLDLLIANIQDLKKGQEIQKPVYDFKVHNRSKNKEIIQPTEVLIIEGLFVLLDERLRNLCDFRIYVDEDADIRFIRRLKRDINERGRDLDSIISQYLSTVKPMHEAFVEPSKKFAHVIIPIGIENKMAVDLITTKINAILQ